MQRYSEYEASISVPRTPEEADASQLNPRTVKYSFTRPHASPKLIVIVVHGFGNDGSQSYNRRLRQKIACDFSACVVTVNYHNYRSRPVTGANITKLYECIKRSH